MRRNLIFGMLIAGAMVMMSSTCSSDDDNGNNNVNVTELNSVTTNGTWRISNFVDSEQNETSDFTNYVFTFNSNGTVTAVNGDNTVEGSWYIDDSSSSDDDDSSSSSGPDFVLVFNVDASSNFEDLNDDWDIAGYDNNTIDLYDVSGGDGTTDILVFTKD